MDILIPFVTSDDPVWKAEIAKYSPLFDESRYRDYGTLKYLFRGVEKFMPFIDRIVLLVSSESQIPEWVNRRTVRVVSHAAIMPDYLLPTFNSSVIECFINNIPDLSGRFIYANDDMFPLAPMTEDCFFRDERPVVNYIKMEESDTPFLKMCRNTSNLARTLVGDCDIKDWFYKPAHFFSPMLKQVNKALLDEAWKFLPGSYSRFRKEKNYNQYLYQDYYIASGLSINAPFAYTAKRALLKDDTQVEGIVCDIKSGRYQMYCINDEYKGERVEDMMHLIRDAFEEVLPKKSVYEI